MKKTSPVDRVRERQEKLEKMMSQQGEEQKKPEEDKNLSPAGTEPQQEPQPPTQPEPEIKPEPQPDPNPVPQPQSGTDKVTGTDTGTQTGTDTLLQQLMKPSESYIRKVYYPLDYQEEFVRKKAKKYKRTESEIIRIAIDELMKSGKI